MMNKNTIDMFPERIKDIVKEMQYVVDNVGRDEDSVYIFEDKYVLKVSEDKNRLPDEKARTDYLGSRDFPCGRSICYLEENGKCYYLRTCIKGHSLINANFLENPELLTDILVRAIDALRKLDNSDCPFRSKDNTGSDFVHGDLCLPNIFADDNGVFTGFIDLDNAGLGDRWCDYAWLLWSLEHNLKTNKYNRLLLDKLGIQFNQEKYNQYIPEEYKGAHESSVDKLDDKIITI